MEWEQQWGSARDEGHGSRMECKWEWGYVMSQPGPLRPGPGHISLQLAPTTVHRSPFGRHSLMTSDQCRAMPVNQHPHVTDDCTSLSARPVQTGTAGSLK